jgi:hypothetical protein
LADARLFQLPEYRLVEQLVVESEFLQSSECDVVVVPRAVGHAGTGVGLVLVYLQRRQRA